MLRPLSLLAVIVVIGLPFGARADLTEAQRQERCGNNQGRIKALETELKSNRDFKSDEEIARLRAEMKAVQGARIRSRKYQDCLKDGGTGRPGVPCETLAPTSDQLELLEKMKARYALDYDNELQFRVEQEIDAAVAARPRLIEINQQLSFHQNRLVELQCASTPERTTEPQTASKPSDPGSSETGGSCDLGKRWQMRARLKDATDGWVPIVWTRQGDSNRWTGEGFGAADQITVSLNGDRVTFTSTKPLLGMLFDDDWNCTYHGTLRGSAITGGTGECPPAPIAFVWEATVECQ